MANGRASTSDAARRGSTRAPMEEAMPISPQGVINNDFHPVDSGLEATNDHWGTEKNSHNDQYGTRPQREGESQRGMTTRTDFYNRR